ACRQNTYDLAILDLKQPHGSGLAAVNQIKMEFPELSVSVVADRGDPGLVDEALRSGAEDFLVKGDFGRPRLERLFRCAALKRSYYAKCFELQGRLRLATSVLPICMWISRDGATVYNVIGNAERFLGDAGDLWAGRKILDLFEGLNGEAEAKLEDCIEKANLGRSSRQVFFYEGKWLESYIVGVRESGQVVLHGLVTDVTPLKESEIKFRQAKREMERVHKSKLEFLESVSHDLRTPLNGIIGAAQLLRYRKDDSTHESLVQNVLACSENLLALIDDVLELKFVGNGGFEDSDKDFNVDQVLESCINTIEPLARDKGVALHSVLDADTRGWMVRSSEKALRRVLVNLLGNAVKYTDKGEVRVTLSVEEIHDGNFELRGCVEDTGIGIPEGMKQVLFSAHHAGNPISAERSGTGLGLVICKRILDNLGGQIHVESQLGKGSCFTFSYPVEVLACRLPRERTNILNGIISSSTHECPRRVLVVDDLEENRFILSEMVRFFGIDCDAAEGAEEAEMLCQTNCYSDIFMDMRMPKIDGFSAVERLRGLEQGRECPPSHIVAVTASNTEEYRSRCMEVGCDEFIAKPITMGRLKRYFAN
ncbi:MAG: response regulator, partial [Bdellovibrionales bacterium]|nr:response regulator [Bdellovibrionales bacterium]